MGIPVCRICRTVQKNREYRIFLLANAFASFFSSLASLVVWLTVEKLAWERRHILGLSTFVANMTGNSKAVEAVRGLCHVYLEERGKHIADTLDGVFLLQLCKRDTSRSVIGNWERVSSVLAQQKDPSLR
ncbi:hypothetical protein AMD24_00479 [Candidatus Xiphinematobacter sp. Idaho Grape]|uniref:hypothetical protein n=1 Tax=Candidatus Xiphinematobacter sp. Idaho Grape TaxID=1704307 RepID=UPI0007064B7C|nr:hypothetical protein [Candidatus Xiphinematobacter sp. Idaho Grape]ALJ56651.1 hypothetical protein AMD24_00479 [Candidatus Xiphinematobacter sp. Idaho Grape]